MGALASSASSSLSPSREMPSPSREIASPSREMADPQVDVRDALAKGARLLSGAADDAQRDALGGAVVSRLASVAPSVTDRILARAVSTP